MAEVVSQHDEALALWGVEGATVLLVPRQLLQRHVLVLPGADRGHGRVVAGAEKGWGTNVECGKGQADLENVPTMEDMFEEAERGQ